MFKLTFDSYLRRNPYEGLYIVIEGIDGSGKSTQMHLLKDYLESKGKKVILTSEPKKDLLIGSLIKDILLAKIKVPAKAYQYLYSADRIINHRTIIEPALKRGEVVVSHRCFWSAISYGMLDRKEEEFSKKHTDPLFVSQGIFSKFHQFIAPDITIYLDVEVDFAVKRLNLMEKQKEIYENKEKLGKIIKGYKWLLKQFSKEFIIVDGSKSVEEVSKTIWRHAELVSASL